MLPALERPFPLPQTSGTTRITRTHVAQSGNGNTGILRSYQITPSLNTGLQATLAFAYDDGELNGITESRLALFKSTNAGSTWIGEGGTVDPNLNTVTVSGINDFSLWTLGDLNAPLGLSVPLLALPLNGTVDVSVNPTLSWNASTGAASYEVQVSTAPSFSPATIVFDQSNITGTSKQVSGLANNTLYYWRVNATNATGTSGWSTTWAFTTIVLAPTLASPGNGASSQPLSLQVSWNAASGAMSYQLQVSTVPDFSTTVYDQSNIHVTTRRVDGLAVGTLYYWRVNATYAVGTSAWSSVWTFTTVPAAPTLASPASGATGVSITPTLTWNALSGATSYQVQVSTTSDFSTTTTIFIQSNITTTSQQLSGLAIGTVYYWRVNATYAVGTSGWSDIWSFTTATAPPPVPTLVSPTNGAHRQPLSLQLSWNVSSGATSYELQVSTAPDFSTTVFDQSNIHGTTRQVNGLADGTVYYWRVNATDAGGMSAWSDVWSFSTSLVAPTLVSPSNGATGISVTPTLSWNASSGATSYQVQVSTASNFAISTTVFNQSNITTTSQQVSGLAIRTTYYWRVNASDAVGTSGWSEIWSFTTPTVPPPVPTLVSPLNGAQSQPLGLFFMWQAIARARSYQLQVSTVPDFSTTIFDRSNIQASPQVVNGLAVGTLYYWRVNETDGDGTSAWSDVWSFSTSMAAPTLVSPSNAATGVSITPTVSWNASSGATSYQVQVSTVSNFSTTVFNQSNITSTSQQVSGLVIGTLYYWRVNATYAVGTSAWSSVWSFTTVIQLPPAPALVSPANAAIGVTINPTALTWATSVGATSYQLQVSTTPHFAYTIFDQSGINGASQQVSGLTNNTLYYWRVKAANADGTSDWSTTWTFTTLLAVPTLASPANGATGISVTPTLSWNATAGAASYRLQVSTDPGFASQPVFDQSNITGTSQQVSGLANNTLYYWRVNATNAGGTSVYSTAWTFTTILASPMLASPASGATGISLSPTLSWNATAGAASYELQASTNSSFTPPLAFDQSNITGTSLQVSGLANNTLYYWRVNATNSGGTSAYSTSWTFTTILASPALASPANAATGISLTPTLSWNAVAGAVSYQLQVSLSSDFSAPFFNQSNITGTSLQVSGLANNTLYYWHVNATNTAGTSTYSSAWSFTTIVAAPTLASPANAAIGVVTNPTLTWNAVSGATSYELQVSTNADLSSPVFDQSNIAGTSQQVPGLINNTMYYWHVVATNTGGTGSPSVVWSFTTILAAPTLAAPANGATGVATNPTFSWNAVSGGGII